MSSPEIDTATEAETATDADAPADEARTALLDGLRAELGEAVLDAHHDRGRELWVRVASDGWEAAGRCARDRLRCEYFCFLSAIDWLPSPFGRSMDSDVDTVLEDLGLFSAIAALATEFSASSGVFVRRHLAPGLPPLAAEKELVIYRVAQEALTNVARHAAAETVELSLTRQGEWIALRVGDDGRGLGGRPEGAGIRGMRERALLVGGQLRMDPAPKGTQLCLLVPVGDVG